MWSVTKTEMSSKKKIPKKPRASKDKPAEVIQPDNSPTKRRNQEQQMIRAFGACSVTSDVNVSLDSQGKWEHNRVKKCSVC